MIRSGNSTLTSKEIGDEAKVYKGSENVMMYKRSNFKTFLCEFNMFLYPFDTQTCTINIEVPTEDSDFIALKPGKLILLRTKELMQYIIINYKLEREKSSEVILKLTLGRKVLSKMLTIYLPSLLIIMLKTLG